MKEIFDMGLEEKISKGKIFVRIHFNKIRNCGCIYIYRVKKLIIENFGEDFRTVKIFGGQLYIGCQEQGNLSEKESWVSPDQRPYLWEYMPFQFKDVCIFPVDNGRRFLSAKRLYPISSRTSFSVKNDPEKEFTAVLKDQEDLGENLGKFLLKIGVSKKDVNDLERKILSKFQS